MKIKLMFACLLTSFTLPGMDNKDIRKNIIPFFDISSACNLALTCRNYQDDFHEAIEKGSFYNYTEALQLPLFSSLQFNYHICTNLLISYACFYRDINIRLQQTPSTINNLKDINTLKYQRKKYKSRFNSVWKYSVINSEDPKPIVRGASI